MVADLLRDADAWCRHPRSRAPAGCSSGGSQPTPPRRCSPSGRHAATSRATRRGASAGFLPRRRSKDGVQIRLRIPGLHEHPVLAAFCDERPTFGEGEGKGIPGRRHPVEGDRAPVVVGPELVPRVLENHELRGHGIAALEKLRDLPEEVVVWIEWKMSPADHHGTRADERQREKQQTLHEAGDPAPSSEQQHSVNAGEVEEWEAPQSAPRTWVGTREPGGDHVEHERADAEREDPGGGKAREHQRPEEDGLEHRAAEVQYVEAGGADEEVGQRNAQRFCQVLARGGSPSTDTTKRGAEAVA